MHSSTLIKLERRKQYNVNTSLPATVMDAAMFSSTRVSSATKLLLTFSEPLADAAPAEANSDLAWKKLDCL
ncbi:hypothetical protein N7510_006623 [Penicillium lagena]|uniref:uncharacterized protein n=1 Tax=Penicillium lagena TaxID=94218 RepID=UPI0025405A1B|nr:uncharacterized protein N7510_006623 [Penicillium lagena]KAJ5613429.1 hypothetical protein N7510_006623 [Penicillium lagena]